LQKLEKPELMQTVFGPTQSEMDKDDWKT